MNREMVEKERNRGGAFTIKNNTIYNENCLDTMSRMKDGVIDLTVTSPPYDGFEKLKYDNKFKIRGLFGTYEVDT
jgi:DNA modification methylase